MLKFAAVGGVGFVVDSLVLLGLYEYAGIPLLPARCLAFVAAASSNWALNRVYTFAGRNAVAARHLEWLRFLLSATISAVPNVGLFAVLMLILPRQLPWIFAAMITGILAGYWCNYQLAKRWVFRVGTTGPVG